MNDKQYKLARLVSYRFKQGADMGEDLEKFLEIAALAVANPGAYTQQAQAAGNGKWVEDDLTKLKAFLQKHGRKASETGEVVKVPVKQVITAAPWVRCSGFTPDHQPGVNANKGSAEFKALRYAEGQFNVTPGLGGVEKPPQKFCIPATNTLQTYGNFTEGYDASQLVKDGDAVPQPNGDGQPGKWVKLTPQFFEKYGYEFSTDGQQVKPTREKLKAWLKKKTTQQQRESGVVIMADSYNGISDELLRQGLAEADGLHQVKITAEQFKSLGSFDEEMTAA